MPEMDLQTKISNMLDEIPDLQAGTQGHAISKHDARWLANLMLVIIESGGCNRGLSEEQAMALKKLSPETIHSLRDIVKERRRLLAFVGAVVVTVFAYIGKKLLDMMDGNFWKILITRVVG